MSRLPEPCWCIGFRMQQAWGTGVVIARAAGTRVLASSSTSNNLAVRRYMTGVIALGFDFELPATSIGDARPVCKYPEVTVVSGSRRGVPAYASRKDFGARTTVGKCREIAGYRSNTQCPPPVNMMTRFITTNMRS